MPLCYVYPAMLHYKACARTRKQKIADIALMVFGLIAAAYTTIQTVRVSGSAFSVILLYLGFSFAPSMIIFGGYFFFSWLSIMLLRIETLTDW